MRTSDYSKQKSYFAYCRKSTDTEEKQALSLDGQSEEIEDFCQKRGMQIKEELRESFSAKKAGRPVFNLMIERLKRGEADGVVTYKADRLTRNYTDLGILAELLETGIEIWDTTFGQYHIEQNGMFMLGLNASLAKQYIVNLAQDTKRGLMQKVEKGWFPGWAPTGYKNNRVEKTIEVDFETAPFIKKAFELYATGQYSLIELADKLYKEGLKSRTGNSYFHRSTLAQILKNPFYYGVFRWRDKVHQGKHEPLIPEELFEKVQAMLEGRAVCPPKPEKKLFTYGNQLMRCGECGCAITAEEHYKISKATGEKLHYIYYRCSKSKGYCSQAYTREKDLEKIMSEILVGIQVTPEIVGYVAEKLEGLYHNDREYQENIEKQLGTKLTKLKQEKKTLFRKMATGAIDDEESYNEVKADIGKEIAEIERQLDKLTRHTRDWLTQSSNLLFLASQAKNLFLKGKREQKRVLINFVSSNRTLRDGNLEFTYKKPFDILAKRASCTDWLHIVNDVRTIIQHQNEYIYIPDLRVYSNA